MCGVCSVPAPVGSMPPDNSVTKFYFVICQTTTKNTSVSASPCHKIEEEENDENLACFSIQYPVSVIIRYN